jgi:hypothetical protein
MNHVGEGSRGFAGRFFARFLYRTTWSRRVLLFSILTLLLGFLIATLVLAIVGQPNPTQLTVAFVLSGLCFLAITTTLLHYSALHATKVRETEAEHLRAEIEEGIVAKLQEALQPQLPVHPEIGFSATYIPAITGATGGDWYDALEMPDGCIFFAIGDVAGHGVEAVATMSRVRLAMISVALRESDPSNVLERANKAMLRNPQFATAICGYIDPAMMRIRYATAGHSPGIIVGVEGRTRVLEYDGLPLGVEDDAAYRTFEIQAENGDLFVLYTDGLVEYDRDIIAGERRVLDALSAIAVRRVDNPAVALREAIFTGNNRQSDDVAIMTVAFAAHASSGDADGDRSQWSVDFRGVRSPLVPDKFAEPGR